MWRNWRKTTLLISFFAVLGFSLFQNCAQNKAQVAKSASKEVEGELDVPEEVIVDVEPPEFVEKAQVSQMVANRILTSNFFISIFGPGATNVVATNVGFHEKDFGSGFSIYETVATADCAKVKNLLVPCSVQASDPQTSSNMGLNIRREAWRLRTCHSVVGVNANLLFALKRIQPSALLTSPPDINDDNLDKAYQLFFRAKPLPDHSLLDALTIVSQKESDPINKWRSVLLTLCLSPHWQVL